MSITDDPIAVFLYALKSPESKRQYTPRFKMFLDFLRLPGDLNSQAKDVPVIRGWEPNSIIYLFMLFILKSRMAYCVRCQILFIELL